MLIVTNKAASVFFALEKLGATPGKIEKDALVRLAGTSSPMFMRVIKAAYDPFTTYGIRKLPDRTPGAAPGSNTPAGKPQTVRFGGHRGSPKSTRLSGRTQW